MQILYIPIEPMCPEHLGCTGLHRNSSLSIDCLKASRPDFGNAFGNAFGNVHFSDSAGLPIHKAS
ncbi:MAG: hypothetical protein ACI9HY_001251 [Planctomycetaceae bacterium]|jgi:hypothetical protein